MPELCSNCGRQGFCSVSQDGVESVLCARCAEDLAGPVGLGSLVRAFDRQRKLGGPCPHCGTTAEKLRQSALVGCPLCYEVFAAEIGSME
jgi:protein-arginine kinase activator protein McsA